MFSWFYTTYSSESKMAKQVVLLLLSAFISTALAVKQCYNCTSETSGKCTTDCNDTDMCVSIAAMTSGVVALNYTAQGCVPAKSCGNVTLGFSKGGVASQCCNSSTCNKEIPAVSNDTKHNGRKCCTSPDCSEIMSCVGDEDFCFNATVSFSSFLKIQTRGCTTKSACNQSISLLNDVTATLTCCDKDLCNGVEKLTLSFFLMMVPLLSFILFH